LEIGNSRIENGLASLDEGDNDLVRFWRYLITACQIALPNVGQTALSLLQGTPPPVEAAITGLELVLVNQVETRIVRNAEVER
jgi:ATP/maltotriose-dependent transcriptional regulator MalT